MNMSANSLTPQDVSRVRRYLTAAQYAGPGMLQEGEMEQLF